jgi:hypothetical protein
MSARAALESVRGTDLTPTRLIYFSDASHGQTTETIRPEEYRNSYSGFFSASAGRETNTLRLESRASYDDIIWYGNLFLKAVASGTGGSDPYTWTFLPTLTSDDVKTATVQLAYDASLIGTQPGVKLNFVMGDTLNIKWEKSEDAAVMIAADFASAKAATQITAFTGSLTDRTVTLMSTNNTTVYIDATTIGSTADSNVIAVDWTLNLNPVPLYTLDATTAAAAVYRPQHRTWTATITRQYNGATGWSAYTAKTVQKIRVTTTTGASRSFQHDMYGVYTNREWADVDGIITEVLTLEPVYDTASTSDFNWVVKNGIAAIT